MLCVVFDPMPSIAVFFHAVGGEQSPFFKAQPSYGVYQGIGVVSLIQNLTMGL